MRAHLSRPNDGLREQPPSLPKASDVVPRLVPWPVQLGIPEGQGAALEHPRVEIGDGGQAVGGFSEVRRQPAEVVWEKALRERVEGGGLFQEAH